MTTAPRPDVHRRLARDLASGRLEDVIAELAETASAVILPYWRTGVTAERKGDQSPVTQADREAEALILARLEAEWPGVQAVAEEASAADGAPDTAQSWFWLIDPLDGTRGFVEGRESFTVNIALIHDGAPVAGVVSAPALGLTWRSDHRGGERGASKRRFGAGWEPIRVRPRPEDGAVALVSHSMSDEESRKLAAHHGCGLWQGTDSSLKFCLIAEGRFDAYPRTGPTSEWDTAAGQAVLEAAGGRVMAPDGAPLRYGKACFANGAFAAFGG